VPEFRERSWRGISGNVGIDDSRGSTRGQLVGRTVEVQVADFGIVYVTPNRCTMALHEEFPQISG
jgi:hypothetical protein